MKKIVIASDSFKGTLSSKQIADIVEKVIIDNHFDVELKKVILGDGGENTLDVFAHHFFSGQYHHLEVTGPNFNKVKAKYFTYDKYAVIELAEAAGLSIATTKNPRITTTYGVGELILDAYKKGYREFYIALGGSSTTDGGCGLLSALGIKFLNKEGQAFIPVGENISNIIKIDDSNLKTKDARFIILSDVKNPMFGPLGASYIFAKQKGASNEDIVLLDNNLRYLSDLFISYKNKHVDSIPGSGAAGATSSGMLAYLNAKIVSGINTILAKIDFKSIIKDTDYVITGEGKLDEQSFNGKLISGVLNITKEVNVPTICVCGINQINNDYKTGFKKIYQTSHDEDFEYIKNNAEKMYYSTIVNLFKDIL